MAKVGQAAWAALAAHMASDEAPSSAQRVRADFVEGERVSCTTRIKPAASAEREKEESSREAAGRGRRAGEEGAVAGSEYPSAARCEGRNGRGKA
eukprot:scaffold17268_cov89-Isochrysis_galbana.AAC.2